MGKGKKQSASDKKESFWNAIRENSLSGLRGALSLTAVEAHTRTDDDEQLTSIMLASSLGHDKILDCLLDWYERRKVLRPKGWIELIDDHGNTALHLAVLSGSKKSVENLLLKGANLAKKNDDGKTPRDIAVAKKFDDIIATIDDWLHVSDDEQDDGGEAEGDDGLTSTQRNKLKKKQKEAEEKRGALAAASGDGSASGDASASASSSSAAKSEAKPKEKGPKPIWPEIAKIAKSVDDLKPLHEVSIVRKTESAIEEAVRKFPGCIDPAVWYQYSINRLHIELPKGVLTSIPGQDLCRLDGLIFLILNNNSLKSLPEEIGQLRELRVLEVAGNELTELPASMNQLEKLETLNAMGNHLTNLKSISKLKSLSVVNVSENDLDSLDDLDFVAMSARLRDFACSGNKIRILPSTLGSLGQLTKFEAERNLIEGLPKDLAKLKKIITIKLDDNPIKDSKVTKYLEKGGGTGKELKHLLKHLEKFGLDEKKSSAAAASASASSDNEEEADEIDEDDL